VLVRFNYVLVTTRSREKTDDRRLFIVVGVQLCVQRDGHDAARRAGLSAAAYGQLTPPDTTQLDSRVESRRAVERCELNTFEI